MISFILRKPPFSRNKYLFNITIIKENHTYIVTTENASEEFSLKVIEHLILNLACSLGSFFKAFFGFPYKISDERMKHFTPKQPFVSIIQWQACVGDGPSHHFIECSAAGTH